MNVSYLVWSNRRMSGQSLVYAHISTTRQAYKTNGMPCYTSLQKYIPKYYIHNDLSNNQSKAEQRR